MTNNMNIGIAKITLALTLLVGVQVSLAAGESLPPITADPADTLANSDGTVTFPKNNFGRTGQWSSNASVTGVLVLPFALPEPPEGKQISSATLTLNLEGWRNLEVSLGDVDLYALRVAAKPDVLVSDYFNAEIDAADAEANPPQGTVLIQGDLLPASQIDKFKMEVNQPVTTSEAGSAALGEWIQQQYDNGAKPGAFVFLAVAIDNPSKATDGSYYLFSTSEGATAPTLTLNAGAAEEEPE